MFDLLAEEYKEKIVAATNESGLPLTAAAYILQEILTQVAALAHRQAAEQKKQRDAETSAEKEQ
jgi:hypothetical protein